MSELVLEMEGKVKIIETENGEVVSESELDSVLVLELIEKAIEEGLKLMEEDGE